MKSFLPNTPLSKGFSLIELIVSFSILSVLATVSIIGFSNYNEVQQVNQSAIDLELMVKEAKNNAQSVVKTINDQKGDEKKCDDLNLKSYRMIMSADGSGATLYMVCEDQEDDPPTEYPMLIRTITLSNDVSVAITDGDRCSIIEFEALFSNSTILAANGSNECEIKVVKDLKEKVIEVGSNGNTSIE